MDNGMRKLVLIIALLLTLGIAELGQCARLKDIADVEGCEVTSCSATV